MLGAHRGLRCFQNESFLKWSWQVCAVEMTRCPTLPFAGGDLWPEWLTPPPRGHLLEAPGAFLLMEHWSEDMSLPGRSSQETSVLFLLFFFPPLRVQQKILASRVPKSPREELSIIRNPDLLVIQK